MKQLSSPIKCFYHCIFFLSVVLSANLLIGVAHAQSVTEGKVRALYLYNFAKNIDWPNQEALTGFNIALYRTEEKELVDTLRSLEEDGRLKNKPISVSKVYKVESLAKYQLVYVESPSAELISQIYRVTDGRPILIVTRDYANKQEVMINLHSVVDGLMKFEVNKSNILNQGLVPLPELILNGGTEIDVAKLFREGQASLIALQKQLANREAALLDLSAKISLQEEKNSSLEKRLISLNKNIRDSVQMIEEQKALLASQNEEIEKSQSDRARLLKEVDQRTRELEVQKNALDVSRAKLYEIAEQIDEREKRLASLNKRISLQESQLNEQKTEIFALDEQVTSQQIVLRYLWGMVGLGVLLVATIFAAYFIKQRDNLRLAAHSHQLHLATEKLALAKKKAEQASQAKSDFLSLMSHELRTPLQAIIGYTHVVIEDMEEEGLFNQVDDLQRVLQNGERLLKMINGVLDLAKIESGKMDLDLAPTDLRLLAEQAQNAVRPQFEKNANVLHVDVRTQSRSVSLDGEKLLHIMINLLSNATKFTEKGRVTLTIEQTENNLYVAVEDSGIGMTPSQQLQIFERFEQADSGTTRKFQGSGLGLSISRQFCLLMGGEIAVESETSKGSKFTMNIPLPIRSSDTRVVKSAA